MTNLLPNWMMERYLLLWTKFKDRKFDFKEARDRLSHSKYSKDSDAIRSLFLSELKKAGWVKVDVNPDDTRKRFYTLVPYDKVFKEVINDIKIKDE